jgi:beta-N-acetylhexosaminidase
MAGHPEWASEAAHVIGEELLSTGVNMNLAPVVDINSEPRNPIIGIRSFGENAEIVTKCAAYALQGYKKAGIITTLKHYPGHGEAKVDSHEDLPVICKSLEDLEACELKPFKTLKADAVMTAHLLVPALDPDHCSTLSKPTLDYLRQDFDGVIITDSLVMGGVLRPSATIEEVAKRAFLAGSDILLLGGKHLSGSTVELTVKDVIRVHKHLVEAVKNKDISEERLNASVERILKLKNRALSSEPYRGDRLALADSIASKAIRTEEREMVELKDKKIAYYHYDKLPETPEIADVSVIFTYNAWKSPVQTAFINSLKRPYIIVALRDPLDAQYFPGASRVIMTYSPSEPSIKAALKLLNDR